MPRPRLHPRKAPRQQRSLATVELILAAATRVLARESLAGFNTNRVAEVAGISVGSLYQYFPNKDAIVTALIERAQAGLAQAVEAVLAQTAGLPLRAALRAFVRLAIEQQYAQPLLAAAIDHEERRLPLGERLRRSEARLAEAVERLLERHRPELAPDLPHGSARDCLVIAKALVEADSATGHAAPPDLEERMLHALLAYLTTSTSEPRQGRHAARRRLITTSAT